MDGTTLWLLGLSIICGLVAFFAKREVERVDEELDRFDVFSTMINAIQLDLAKNYSTKEEVKDTVTRLEKRIDDGFDKLGVKIDVVFERMDKKQDKI